MQTLQTLGVLDRGVALALGLALSLTALSGPAEALTPLQISYQGQILAQDGSPLSGATEMVLRIWDASTRDAAFLYEETHTRVPLQNGIFSIELGTGLPTLPELGTGRGPLFRRLTADVFAGQSRWLEVVVNGEVLSPRQQIGSVGYAFQSEISQTAATATFAQTAGAADTATTATTATFAQTAGTATTATFAQRASDANSVGGLAAGDLQQRVRIGCPPGQAIQSIAADGTVSCDDSTPGHVCPLGHVLIGFDADNGLICAPGLRCPISQLFCDGKCVEESGSIEHCGQCGNACTIANGTPGCGSGVCFVSSCDSGWVDCNSLISDGCEANFERTRSNCGGCGFACATNEICAQGTCTTCPEGRGLTACDDGCVVIAANNNHCGGCGVRCDDSAVCMEGTCQPCAAIGDGSLVRCGAVCADLNSDVSNCGVCFNSCPSAPSFVYPPRECFFGFCNYTGRELGEF